MTGNGRGGSSPLLSTKKLPNGSFVCSESGLELGKGETVRFCLPRKGSGKPEGFHERSGATSEMSSSEH